MKIIAVSKKAPVAAIRAIEIIDFVPISE